MGCDLLSRLDLVVRPDLGSDVDVFSILDWLKIPDGWSQAAADGDMPVDEVMTIHIPGDDHDGLAENVLALDNEIKKITWAQNPRQINGVWLRVQLKNETNQRQAFLLKGKRGPARVTSAAILGSFLHQYPLGLTRMPGWEATSFVTEDHTGIDCLGGMHALSTVTSGDLPGRIASIRFYPEGSASLNRFYAGFRTSTYGVAANFQPVWSLHLGQASSRSADTTEEADGDAYDDTRLTVDFSSTTTLARRVIVDVQDVTAHSGDQCGLYHVLLRACMSDASTANVRIGFGFDDRSTPTIRNVTYRQLQLVSGTAYTLYEMGSVALPTEPLETVISMANMAIQIDAQRVTGNGDLHIDCLILIPADEGFVSASSLNNLGSSSVGNITRLPNGRLKGVINRGGYGLPDRETIDVFALSEDNWCLPVNDEAPYLILAAQGSAGSVKGDTAAIVMQYCTRYSTLRGAA